MKTLRPPKQERVDCMLDVVGIFHTVKIMPETLIEDTATKPDSYE